MFLYVGGHSSTWCVIISDMLQGSLLNPLLFNIYVNYMASQVNSAVLQFADDLKMFRAIHDIAYFHQLQAYIDILVAWANKWQLKFYINVSKCHLLHLGGHITMVNITFMGIWYHRGIPSRTWVFSLMIN